MVDDIQAKEFGVDEALRLTGKTDQQSIETIRFANILLTFSVRFSIKIRFLEPRRPLSHLQLYFQTWISN